MLAVSPHKSIKFKRVPAVDKCFRILGLLSGSPSPLGVTEISQRLSLNKSTVFNIIHTLLDLGMIENLQENKVSLGWRFYNLSRAAGPHALLIERVRPLLEEINRRMRLSVFLGVRSRMKAVIIDKVDSPRDIKVSSEIGMMIPLLAGSHGRALLAHLSDDQLDALLSAQPLKQFTPRSVVQPAQFKREVQKTRRDRFAFDDEGYLEGIRSLAAPILLDRSDFQPAVWAVGLKSQITDAMIPEYKTLLKQTGRRIETLYTTENETREEHA